MRIHWRVGIALGVVLLALAPICLSAAVTGSLSGTVKARDGAAVPGATVIVTNTGTALVTETATDAKGVYSFPILPVGCYDLKVEKSGFGTQSKDNLDVQGDSVLVENVTMTPGGALRTGWRLSHLPDGLRPDSNGVR